jgi:hypothetical protein
VTAGLDTLLIALYAELTDHVVPSSRNGGRRPGRPPEVTGAELVCLAVAQVLLRYDDERHWLRAAPRRAGHLFPRLPGQSEYNERVKAAAPLMEAALRWPAEATPGSAELLKDHPANRPAPGTAVVTDQGLAGQETETFFASPDLGLALIRPARKDDKEPRSFPNWPRQRVEAITWTLKNQLGLERHGGRVPGGLWTRAVQRLLAPNTCTWHNWLTGAPVKRSLIAYDH